MKANFKECNATKNMFYNALHIWEGPLFVGLPSPMAQRRSKLLKSPRNLPCNSVEIFSTSLGTAWDMGISDLILNSESCLVVSNIFIVNHSGISWAVDPELV